MALPSVTTTFDNLYTSTWNLVRRNAEDVIFKSRALWVQLTKKGKKRSETPIGTWIGIPLEYAVNQTVAAIGRGGTVSIADTEFLTEAKYNWKYIAGSVVRYYQDEKQNRGRAQILNLVSAKLRNCRKSIEKKLNTDAFGDGTGDGGKTIGGLDTYIVEAPSSGTVANINRANYTWWANKYKDLSTKEISVYMVPYMRTLFNDCSEGDGVDTPDFLITDQGSYEDYMAEADEIHRLVNKDLYDAGFPNVEFMGKPLTWDAACKANSMYFLNLDYIEMVVDDINFEMTDWKSIPNQPGDRVAQMIFGGNLVISNMARQGVLFDIGEAT